MFLSFFVIKAIPELEGKTHNNARYANTAIVFDYEIEWHDRFTRYLWTSFDWKIMSANMRKDFWNL